MGRYAPGAPLPGYLPDGFTPLPPDRSGARGYRLGAPGTGMPIILLPGIEGDARVFANQVELAKDRTVIALDLPRGCESLNEAATAVLKRIQSQWGKALPYPNTGARVAVVGLSLGGLVGWAMAALARDRIGALITLGTLPSPNLVPPHIRRGRLGANALPAPIFDLIYGAQLRHKLHSEGADPMLTTQVVSELPEKAEIIRRLDCVFRWGLPEEIGVPALWLLGQVDAESAWTPADVLRELPEIAVEIVPGGHRAPLTHPVAFHDAVNRFLLRYGV